MNKAIFSLISLALFTTMWQSFPLISGEKFLIQSGRDTPVAEDFRKYYPLFNTLPFDGAAVRVRTDLKGGDLVKDGFTWAFQNDKHWNEKMFLNSIENLKAVATDRDRRLKHNFLEVKAIPGSLDWFDDSGWQELIWRMTLAARICAQGGLEGIIFDPEPWRVLPHRQFSYLAQTGSSNHSYAEYCRMARQRGAEVMAAMAREHPRLVIFARHLLNALLPAFKPDGGRCARIGDDYDLLPAFVDGWLDARTSGITIIDGNEDGYLYANPNDYAHGIERIIHQNPQLLAAEHREPPTASIEASFGFYLDGYLQQKGEFYFKPTNGKTSAQLLHDNLSCALRWANKWVWIHGEQARWWPGGLTTRLPEWPQKFPGITQALTVTAAERQPPAVSIPPSKAVPEYSPIQVRNGSIRDTSGWTFWSEGGQGMGNFEENTGHLEAGSLAVRAPRKGAWIQLIPVQPGATYNVQAWCWEGVDSYASLLATWKDTDRRFTAMQRNLAFVPDPARQGWKAIQGTLTIPKGVAYLCLQLTSASNGNLKSVCYFDDIALTPAR